MSEDRIVVTRDSPAEYALGFEAVAGGVRLDIVATDFALSLLLSPPDAKRACEMLLAAYGTAFDRRPHGVTITHKKQE